MKFIVMMLLTLLVMAACGTGADNVADAGGAAAPAPAGEAAGQDAGTAGGDAVILWTTAGDETIPNWNENVILQAIEAATNTDINVVAVGGHALIDQLNAAIAGGTLPDIIPVLGPEHRGLLERWVHDGVLAAYEGEVAAAAPNVIRQYEENLLLTELKVDGRIFFQPVFWGFGLYPNGGLIYVRRDLLDQLNMDPPNTFEEYFQYLRAAMDAGFGSGVVFSGADAGGLINALSSFVGAYGGPVRGWVQTGTGFEYWAVQPETEQGLLLFREMIAEGLVNPASWEMGDEQSRAALVSGAAVSGIFWGGGHIGRLQNDMELVDPNFKIWMLPALDAGAGHRGYTSEAMFWGTGQLGGMSHNNPVPAARVINFLISEEGTRLTALGIEGVHHENQNGDIRLLPDQRIQDGFPTEAGATGAHPLATHLVSWVPQELQNFQLLYGRDNAFRDWFYQMWENQGRYQISSYGQITSAGSWAGFQAMSNELIARSFIQIVNSGSAEEASRLFSEFVDSWYASGGNQAQADMSAALQEMYN